MILVPTDFSKNASSALETAFQIAKNTGSHIVLLHAYRLQDAHAGSRQSTISIKHERDSHAQDKLLQLKTLAPGIQVEIVLDVGFVIHSINEAINAFHPWLVVMGQRGNSSKRGLGSTAREALQLKGCPIMLVPDDYKLEDISDVFIDTQVRRNDTIDKLVSQVLISKPRIVKTLPKDHPAVIFTTKRSTNPTRDLPTIFSDK